MAPVPADSTVEEVRAAVERVRGKAQEWFDLPLADKIAILKEIQALLRADRGAEWAREAAKVRGYDAEDPAQAHLLGECSVLGSTMTGFHLHYTIAALEARQAAGGKSLPPAATTVRQAANQVRVQTFPHPSGGLKEKLAANGMVGELVLEGLAPVQDSDAPEEGVEEFRRGPGVVGILGAGNFDAPTDILEVLFGSSKVAVYKPNPVNAASTVYASRFLEPLVRRGYLAYVHGGIPQGEALATAPGLAGLLMTGSARGYNSILWGRPEGPAAPGAAPRIDTPFVAELGSVNPFVVFPGKWSDSELDAQASHLVGLRLLNGSHVCASPQVLITHRGWPQREEFLARVRRVLAAAVPNRSYYPNADRMYAQQVERLAAESGLPREQIVTPRPAGEKAPAGFLPAAFASVPADREAPLAESCEAFAPVLVEVALDAAGPAEFLAAATAHVNDKLFGNLTATIVISDRSAKEHAEALERAVDEMRVGALGINVAGMFAVMYPQLTWGAYGRGDPRERIQSGRGRMGNTHRYAHVLKAVIRAPFIYPGMTQAVTDAAKSGKQFGCLNGFAVDASWGSLIRLAINASTGL